MGTGASVGAAVNAHLPDEDAEDAERLHSLHLDHSNRVRSPSQAGTLMCQQRSGLSEGGAGICPVAHELRGTFFVSDTPPVADLLYHLSPWKVGSALVNDPW